LGDRDERILYARNYHSPGYGSTMIPEILQNPDFAHTGDRERWINEIVRLYFQVPGKKFNYQTVANFEDLRTRDDAAVAVQYLIYFADLAARGIATFYSVPEPKLLHSCVAMLTEGGLQIPHADNQKVEGGKWVPNHIPGRTYTAVLYLNDGFTGGDIRFPGRGVQLHPTRGLLLAYPSDGRFYHEVLPVTGGVRLSVLMGFGNGGLANRGF